MSQFVENEMMKLYLGTLFLTNYNMPALCDVKDLIDAAFLKYPSGGPFGSYVLRMAHLIENLEQFNETLIQLGRNNFLGPYEDLLKKQHSDFAGDSQSASLKFFESFFEKPRNHGDFTELCDWCLHVVQFAEANEERTVEAMKFLGDVKDYIHQKNDGAMEKLRQAAVEKRRKMEKLRQFAVEEKRKKDLEKLRQVEERRKMEEEMKKLGLKKKFEEEWKLRYRRADCACTVEVANITMCKGCLALSQNYHDTKSCDCYEYEVSGDCNCDLDL